MHSDTTPYVDQSPDALQLTLTEGDLDRTQFHLLSQQDCEFGGVKVSAAVIGASHVISYDTGAFTLHEIFACAGLEEVSSWPLSQLTASPVVRQYPGFRYEFEAQVVGWSDPEPDVVAELVEEATHLHAADGVGLVVDFPQGDLLVSPKTIVFGETLPGNNGVVFITAHSYPNVRGLVLSRSTLQYT